MKLYETDNWEVVFVSWVQEFVGNCIISNKNKKQSLSELTDEEWQELGRIEKMLEGINKKLFNSTMFNFCCLMNNAYRDKETPNVHFWFVPRYENVLEIFGKKYKDKHFGYNFWKWSLSKFKAQKNIFSKEEIQKIYDLMKEEINNLEKNNV